MECGPSLVHLQTAACKALSLIATASPGRAVRVWDFQTLRLDDVCVGLTDDAIAIALLEPYPVLLVATAERRPAWLIARTTKVAAPV